MDFPFKEKQISSDRFLREFDKDTNSDDLIWHMDREDRYITIKSGTNWKLQLDNQLPVNLLEKKVYFIPKYTYHRIIKGNSSLFIEIKKVLTGETT